MGKALICPANWGLGHATRDIPLIRHLLAKGHEVHIGATGAAKALLAKEFPGCPMHELVGYDARYSRSRFFIPTFLARTPRIIKSFADEHREVERLTAKHSYDLIIGDGRYGACSAKAPSIIISHQIRLVFPYLRPVERLTQLFNWSYFKRFAHIVVPDNDPETGPALAGRLAWTSVRPMRDKLHYMGILSSIRKSPKKEDIDYLVVLSGPEPQRTLLERIIRKQVGGLSGRRVVLLARPDTDIHEETGDLLIRSHTPRAEMVDYMNRAKFIITRSGYTTVMELAEIGKTRALMTPTPGQTEQTYLSSYYEGKRWYHNVDQYALDIVRDIEESKGYTGFPEMPKTEENVTRAYAEIFARYLE
ncbi:hypothetical protein JXB02_02500 [Candidatus Woesearchaeota archaeon]|nr:hypothetical protein [Candidatus Woesearchaeota archaeon]